MQRRRRVWQCKRCGAQTSVTAGTVMHKSHLPLRPWFWAAYLVATHHPGISAVQLQRQLGLRRHETAWMMLHKLRRAMVAPEREPLKREVEVDEFFLGGVEAGHKGRGPGTKKVLCGVAVEVRGRGSGRVRLQVLADASGKSLGVLRGQEVLFGAVASESTAHRVIKSIDGRLLDSIRAARAQARARAWEAGARPDDLIIDFDATLLQAHSEKQDARGNYKGGFGFHPLLGYLDGGEAPAALLRAGNAGSNTAADHFEVLGRALEQIPSSDLDREILARADGGGATHAFTDDGREAGIGFSVGYELSPALREALRELPEPAWQQAIEAGGELREGAWVAELSESINLAAWPEGSRLIVRRERAHPGAQLSFSDADGHRFTAFLTDTASEDIAALELRHRRRARVEDSIRSGKDTGMRNLPFHDFSGNEAWLELSLIAQDLLAWAKVLVLDGELTLAEPKRLRQRLFHVAGRIARSGGRTILRLPRSWPWAEALRVAFKRLRALPVAAAP